MVRTFSGSLAVALAVVFAAACGGDKSATKPKGNEPAGSVIALTGEVLAKHAEAQRALKVGDKVMANETIVTGAKASVTIQLFHNDARWELSGGKSRAIRQSLAWNAPKGTSATGAKPTDKTMAAGRHAERQAGTTTPIRELDVESKQDEGAPPPEKTAPATDMTPEVAKNKPVPGAANTAEIRKPSPAKATAERLPAMKPRPTMRPRPPPPRAAKTAMRKRSAPKKSAASRRPKPRNEGVFNSLSGARGVAPKTTGGNSRGGGGLGAGTSTGQGYGTGHGSLKGKKARRARVSMGLTKVAGDMAKLIARRIMARYRGIFRYCYEQGLKANPNLRGLLKLKLRLVASGKVARATLQATKLLTSAVGKCVVARAKRIRFPAQKLGSVVEQTLRFSPP